MQPAPAPEPGPGDWAAPPVQPALGPHEVHLWRIDLAFAAARLAALVELLSADERARMEAFRFEPLRQRFAARRGALRTILARYLGRDPRDLAFGQSANGRPELADVPEGAGLRLRFNLSHREDLALLGVTHERDLGVDVERVRPLPDRDAVAGTVFSPAELAAYRSLPEGEREAGFLNGWTRKEAWLKARGQGLGGDLQGFDVSLAPGDPPRLLRVAGEPDEPGAWSLRAFVPRAGFVGALAVRDPRARVRAWSG